MPIHAQVACDKHGWALAYTVEAGNVHDSQAFPALFSKLEPFSPHYIIADSGYKTPAIAHYLLERNIIPVFPYTRPKGVKGNLRPSNFVYDASYDHYVCPENQVLAIAQPLEKATVSIRVILKYVFPVLYYPFVPKARIFKSSNETCLERCP